MNQRTVPPDEITARLVTDGAVLLDAPEYPRCPVTNAYHRIAVVIVDLEQKPHQVFPATMSRGLKNALYKAIFTKFPTADIHDCQLQVWSEPCITFTPFRVRCNRSLSKSIWDNSERVHTHAYARVTYSEDSLPRLDRLYEARVMR